MGRSRFLQAIKNRNKSFGHYLERHAPVSSKTNPIEQFDDFVDWASAQYNIFKATSEDIDDIDEPMFYAGERAGNQRFHDRSFLPERQPNIESYWGHERRYNQRNYSRNAQFRPNYQSNNQYENRPYYQRIDDLPYQHQFDKRINPNNNRDFYETNDMGRNQRSVGFYPNNRSQRSFSNYRNDLGYQDRNNRQGQNVNGPRFDYDYPQYNNYNRRGGGKTTKGRRVPSSDRNRQMPVDLGTTIDLKKPVEFMQNISAETFDNQKHNKVQPRKRQQEYSTNQKN